MTNIGIRVRVMLLTLVPLLVFSLVLGQYMVMSRLQDLEAALQERGETMARFIAAESEFGLFSEDLARLQRVAETYLLESDVHEVQIFDAGRRPVAGATNDRPVDDGTVMRFSAPVLVTGIAVADHDELFAVADVGRAGGDTLGWVDITLSRDATLARQQAIVRNIVIIAGATALLSMMIALWMGRGIVRPIIRLSHAVDGMSKGRLETRVAPSTGGEIGALEHGFNDMAEVMEQARNRLQAEITVATGRLQSTIRELEQKNRELDAARERALAAGNEKANFLANMSHEIRTPINAILGYTSLLEKSGLSAEQYEYARTIGFASTQLLCVIDDILSFSRLESGTVQLERVDFDLRDVLEDVLCMLGPEARDRNLELVLLIDSDVPLKLRGDAVRFRQVVINLMNNAIKFTERGGVNIEVRLVSMKDGRIEIELSVVDTGIGIPPEVVDRIFASFHQADASIARRYGGTGLGLAIVSRLVSLWGGSLGVTSEPGAGSTFRFTLVCEPQSSQHDYAAAPALAGRKILLYDDNPVACRAVRNLLMSWSINVYLARHLGQVEDMLATARRAGEAFELVVFGTGTEPTAGGANGAMLEALAECVRREHAIPMLLMANSGRTALLGRSLSDPGLRIAIKPVRRDILHRNLCTLLGIEWPPQQEGPQAAVAEVDDADREFRGLRVLLAEDNEYNRALATRVLEDAGIEVTQVVGGDDALARARAQDFDLVIMDLHLPGMDGAETARRLRELRPAMRHIPIIALTADVFFDHPDNLGKTAIDACLLKPLDEARLWELIRTLCVLPANGEARGCADGVVSAGEVRARLWPKLVAAIAELRAQIRDAAAAGDRRLLAERIHELKGLSGYFGLAELDAGVRELEARLGGEADVEALQSSLRRLDDQIAQACASGPGNAD